MILEFVFKFDSVVGFSCINCLPEFVFEKFVLLLVCTFESIHFLFTQALNFLVEPRLVVAVGGNSLGGDAHRLAETDVGHYAVSKSVYIVLILRFENIPVSDVKTVLYNISIAPGELLLTHLLA